MDIIFTERAIEDCVMHTLGTKTEYGDVEIRIPDDHHELSPDTQRKLRAAIDTIYEILWDHSLGHNPAVLESSKAERAQLLGCFDRPIWVQEIPNEYCTRPCCYRRPWFIVYTVIGPIKIGWRKWVIEIDWSQSDVKTLANELFREEQGTKIDRLIHASDASTARIYITKLLHGAALGMILKKAE